MWFGIGFAQNAGVPMAELEALTAQRGERFPPATKLHEMATKGERSFD